MGTITVVAPWSMRLRNSVLVKSSSITLLLAEAAITGALTIRQAQPRASMAPTALNGMRGADGARVAGGAVRRGNCSVIGKHLSVINKGDAVPGRTRQAGCHAGIVFHRDRIGTLICRGA